MNRVRLKFRRLLLMGTLTVVLSSAALLLPAPQGQAQTFFDRIQLLFNRKRDQGAASGRARGGSVRGVCPQIANLSLIPLSPKSNQGLTVEEYPTFLFYLPFGRTDKVKSAELLLLDKDEILGDPIRFLLPESPGMVSVRLPSDGKPLEIGKQYKWYFSIICQEDEPSINPFVSGWIQRIEPSSDLVKQLQTLSPKDQYVAYVNNGIWYTAVDLLSQNRQMHPEEWKSLLALFELAKFARAPVTELLPEEQREVQSSAGRM
ncbi:DUF928 domain-containing protein [Leptothermofonsia sp. ETS-13]|uniref:DUF928 domain-containing protein n=1 Tax=Leptothermofonsia sp. ETS-13 TaxID=3035696 RepID=UPI003BA28F2C